MSRVGGALERVHIQSAEAGAMAPGGGATEVTLDQIKDLLAAMLPAALGQALASSSMPVVIASNQPMRPWEPLGQEKISANGAQTATLPAGTTIFAITAETANVRYNFNAAADANSFPLSTGTVHVHGPYTPLTSVGIFNASSSVAYLLYFKEG